jgi:glycosyltransferase involved in cell wall biosynthesis
MDLSIAICSYNAQRRLKRVFEALARQDAPPSIQWEILLVDNASTDHTAATARDLARSFSLPLRVLHETEAGLTNARRCGAMHAMGDYLSFVDDDNILEPSWVRTCVEFLRNHPRAGVVGGRIYPEFEDPTSVPANFEEIAPLLAIRDHGPHDILLHPPEHDAPCGASLTGPTHLLRTILARLPCFLTDRVGTSLSSGGDTELALLALRLGYEAWYTPRLRLAHVIPRARLQPGYLHRLKLGIMETRPWLDYLCGLEPRRSRALYLLKSLRQRLKAAKFDLLAWLRPDEAATHKDWADEAAAHARSYWALARHYPHARMEQALKELTAPAISETTLSVPSASAPMPSRARPNPAETPRLSPDHQSEMHPDLIAPPSLPYPMPAEESPAHW